MFKRVWHGLNLVAITREDKERLDDYWKARGVTVKFIVFYTENAKQVYVEEKDYVEASKSAGSAAVVPVGTVQGD